MLVHDVRSRFYQLCFTSTHDEIFIQLQKLFEQRASTTEVLDTICQVLTEYLQKVSADVERIGEGYEKYIQEQRNDLHKRQAEALVEKVEQFKQKLL